MAQALKLGYKASVIAQAFATMGCLYPGRIMLGVGTGEASSAILSASMVRGIR